MESKISSRLKKVQGKKKRDADAVAEKQDESKLLEFASDEPGASQNLLNSKDEDVIF